MTSDFTVDGGIYVVQGTHELDLHNDFAFEDVRYSVAERTATLRWSRRTAAWVRPKTPAAVSITFEGVSEVRFAPRDPAMPFTEDDCISTMGYLTDEPWSKGEVLISDEPGRDWLTAFEFQSGAVIALRAERAVARITPDGEEPPR